MAFRGPQEPNWRKWRHIPDVTLLEGVALSLNLEPILIGHSSFGWSSAQHILDQSQEFEDRLVVARRNVGKRLHFTEITPGHPDEHKVGLAAFVVWALSIEWAMPPQLAELASKQTTAPAENNALFQGGVTAIDAAFDRRLVDIAGEEAPARTSNPAETKRIATLQRLVLAMARAKYGWRRGERNTATGEKAGSIYADVIDQLGEARRLEADTIRTALEEADNAFPLTK